jgi:large subunit ribosomal protein L25
MAKYIQLSARPRDVVGKQVAELRRSGWTPAVIYGHRTEPMSLSVRSADLERLIHAAGTSHLVEVRVEGEPKARMALVRQVQRHVTRHTVLHADFIQVQMDERVRSEVPLAFVGEPALVAHHEAVIDHGISSLHVEALPGDLPEEIQVDLTRLVEMGDAIVAGDISMGPRVHVLTGADEAIARLTPVSRAVLHEEGEEEALEQAAAEAEAEGPAEE